MQNTSGTKKFDLSFPRRVAFVFVVVTAVLFYPLYAFASAEVVRACIAGALVSLANVLAGYAGIEYSIDKSYSTFLRVVLGGMGIRMLAMLGIIIALIEVFHFSPLPLLAALMGWYVLFLILELMFIQKTMSAKAQG